MQGIGTTIVVVAAIAAIILIATRGRGIFSKVASSGGVGVKTFASNLKNGNGRIGRHTIALLSALVLIFLVVPMVLPDVAAFYTSPQRPNEFLLGTIVLLGVIVVTLLSGTTIGRFIALVAIVVLAVATYRESTFSHNTAARETSDNRPPVDHFFLAPNTSVVKEVPPGSCMPYTGADPNGNVFTVETVDAGTPIANGETIRTKGLRFTATMDHKVTVFFSKTEHGTSWCDHGWLINAVSS